MSTATEHSLKGALCIDFTGRVSAYRQLPAFNDELVDLIRQLPDGPSKTLVLIDEAIGTQIDGPVVVRDHLNFTGTSPLIGPNHPCGDRFPVVQGIYIDDQLTDLPRVVAAGLKHGVTPNPNDMKLIKDFGASVCCYNIVPTMLVAAHARCRVLALVVPQGSTLPEALHKEIEKLTGESK